LNPNNSSVNEKNFRTLRNSVDMLFRYQKEKSYKGFTEAIKYVSNETDRFFNLFVIHLYLEFK